MRKSGVVLAVLIALLGIGLIPAGAQAGIVWTSEFYNNGLLIGNAVVTRQDTAIAFDWGPNAPAAGINADGFSARFGTDPLFQAGTYRFWVLADDKIRIYLDYARQPIIDTFAGDRVGQIVSADVPLSQGVHHIQVDYIEESGNAYAFVTWANLATRPTGPNFPPIGGAPSSVTSGPWTAQYYANPSLFGSPTLIQSESNPSRDWGFGSPVSSIPSDNFSARWTSIQTLNAGTYELRVRADDGFRVAIDGVFYLNEWHNATGQTYTTNVTLSAGQKSFLIEFYEASGAAFLDFSFAPLGAGGGFITPTPNSPIFTGASATVTGAFRLNVRNAPNATSGAILTKINRNETYPIVGRNSSNTWWQINVNGVVGWVNARFITATNTGSVPVTDGTVILPTPTTVAINCSSAPPIRMAVGRYGRVTPGVPNNMRQTADPNAALVGQIQPGQIFYVVGGPVCSFGFYWWQVNFNGIVGWTPEGGSGQYWVEPL
jgi:uncharacterized protein YgiM (DUF1202 family)